MQCISTNGSKYIRIFQRRWHGRSTEEILHCTKGSCEVTEVSRKKKRGTQNFYEQKLHEERTSGSEHLMNTQAAQLSQPNHTQKFWDRVVGHLAQISTASYRHGHRKNLLR